MLASSIYKSFHSYTNSVSGCTGAGCPCVVDVTARYASDWCEATRRQRLSESWWRETLQPYSGSRDERKMEDEDIMSKYLHLTLYIHTLNH